MTLQAEKGREFIGRVPQGADLYEWLTQLGQREKISAGILSVIGAVTEAKVAYYHQDSKKYQELCFKEPLEVVSCSGNFSLRDDKVFVHAHVVFSGKTGGTFGGHLLTGCRIFSAEFYVRELTGRSLIRRPDTVTGLHLWRE